MSLKTFQIIDTSSNKVEMEYCYVYPDTYRCIDAKYVNLQSSRSYVLKALKLQTLKLMSINPLASEGDIILHLRELLNKYVASGNRSIVLERDIDTLVGEISSWDNIPDYYLDNLYSRKKIIWKVGLGPLLKLTKQEVEELDRIKGEVKKEKYKREIAGNKKRIYAMNAIREASEADMITNIVYGIEAILETPEAGELSLNSLSRQLNISYPTLKKYVSLIDEKFKNLLEVEGVLDDKRKKMKKENENNLIDACLRIHEKEKYITKILLHKESNVSRPTIDKKLMDEELRLKDYIDELNSML